MDVGKVLRALVDKDVGKQLIVVLPTRAKNRLAPRTPPGARSQHYQVVGVVYSWNIGHC